jgi:hypothetical protein
MSKYSVAKSTYYVKTLKQSEIERKLTQAYLGVRISRSVWSDNLPQNMRDLLATWAEEDRSTLSRLGGVA